MEDPTIAHPSVPVHTDAPSAADYADRAPDSEPLQELPQPVLDANPVANVGETLTPEEPVVDAPKKKAPRKSKGASKKSSKPKKQAAKKTPAPRKSKAVKEAEALETVAVQVMKTRKWGTGRDRDIRLRQAGFNPKAVRREVERLRRESNS